ncbi:hypothetical protein DH2020_012922 [Rehmannia glutinosa]|uniref:Modifier of snc1 n=1 Tax=Rehmannia glutinosa TaxID=99300 RepID=A0ABR0X0R0_REHGL
MADFIGVTDCIMLTYFLFRWASARRGGMTVLGKVAVPKPLNLPSQRGTLSWGSRPSSSGSNPWMSSSLSPNAEGGTVSPGHLSGRPSSGGSGTRPSTAGSDRTHEPVASAWSSNSRPSSASGTLSSNQTSSTSLRPRSAENRPNSSQLSRFAEPMSKTSAAWAPSITAERLGVMDILTYVVLTSGRLPLTDHGRPSSASGRIAHAKEDTKSQADVKHGTVNTWRADGSQGAEDDTRPSMEKWHGDPHQYFNANAGPPHFDAWRGPPMNGPAGTWYGGRPRGPPFGAPVGPGGFPVEPFPYYRPQIPPPPLAGSQPVPPPGPRGPHPKNGDLYRPQMPDAYARPGIPFRPGFYPGPPGPMAFEGYYGPPMGYNERDIPYMGMAAGPPLYNGYPGPAPDIGNSHGRAGRGHAGKTLSEQVDPVQFEDTEGPKRFPLKNHNESDQRAEGETREHNVQHNVPYHERSRHPVMSSRKNEWGADEDTDEAIFAKRRAPNEKSSRSYENRVHSADGVKVKSFEGMGNVKAVNDNWTNMSESVPSFPPEMSRVLVAGERGSSLPAATKNSALMHKIDGLNAKIRVSDGRNDSPSAYNREEERNGSQIVDMKINNYTSEASNTAGSFERTLVSRDLVSVPHEVIVPVSDMPVQPSAIMSRRPHHGGQGRVDHRSKGKFNSQDADGWRKKPLTPESPVAVTASSIESVPSTHGHRPIIVEEASENSVINPAGKIKGDSVETYDSNDIQAQRAKMREIAKQRALQLQKEEEERIREQKAKALAKLEELNRRTLAGEAGNEKAERTQAIGDIRGEKEESHTVGEPATADLKFQEPGWNLVFNSDVAVVERDNNANQAGESVEIVRNLPVETRQTGALESDVSPLPMHEDAHDDGSVRKVASQFNDGGVSRQKRAGYKQKQNNSSHKSSTEKSVSNVAAEAQKDHTRVAGIDITPHEYPSSEIKLNESNMPNTSDTAVEPFAHQRRKNNRNNKNKHKLDETPAMSALPPATSDINPEKESIQNVEAKDSLSNPDSSVPSVIEPDKAVQAQELSSPLSNEESQSRVSSSQWKPHPSRRLPRNQQVNRFVDKLHGSDTAVWAPVRSTQHKAKGSDEASPNSVQESPNLTKDNISQNSLKGKRAEMERYVPKPVAKELAQQVSIPPLSSSIRSNEVAGREQSASQPPVSSAAAHVGSSGDANEGDDSHNKHKKDHGTWRQRGSTNSAHMKGAHIGPSPTSEPRKDIQQSNELGQLVKSEINSVNDIPNNTTTAAVSKYLSVKDQIATGRGKRHAPKGGPLSIGNNPDPDKPFSGEIDGSCSIQSATHDVNSKENRSLGDRKSSHWQPKSNSNTANNQHVTTETNRFPKKEHPQHKVQAAPRHDKDSGSFNQPQPGNSVNVKSNVDQESNVGHQQEFGKKPAPAKGHPYSSNQDPVGSGELPPTANEDVQLERNISSRRNGRQNNRSVGGHEPRGDWNSGHHDNRPHNTPAFRDNNRHRQNVHYEYQPVGPFKGNNKPERVEEPADVADSTDQRHRERGCQSHPRRGGNSYRRQSGPVQVGSGRD